MTDGKGSDAPREAERQVAIEDVQRGLALVIRVSRRWVVLMLGLDALSTISLTFKAGQLEGAVAITPVTVSLIVLIWLPALVNVIALAGGGVKTPAGELSSSGILGLIRSLEPAAQRGALPAVIAALDTGPTRNDPAVASLRHRLQGELAGLPVGEAQTRERLNALAREYETIRETMPGGPDRTFKMTQIVTEARGLAASARLDPLTLSGLYAGPRDGDRIVTLAVIEAQPDPTHVPIVTDTIANARSPFEQYHGLLAARALAPIVSAEDRASLAAAIRGRMGLHLTGVTIDQRDRERLRLAEQVLAMLGDTGR